MLKYLAVIYGIVPFLRGLRHPRHCKEDDDDECSLEADGWLAGWQAGSHHPCFTTK